MGRKLAPKPDDPAQSKRFIETADGLPAGLAVHEAEDRNKISLKNAVVIKVERVGDVAGENFVIRTVLALVGAVGVSVGDVAARGFQMVDEGLEVVGEENIIVIEVGDIFAAGGADAGIARGGEALVLAVIDEAGLRALLDSLASSAD